MAERTDWQPIETAPKDRTPVLLAIRSDLSEFRRREDLRPWDGLQIVARHPGLLPDGFDMGWNMAAPVGHGGFPDEWFAGWMPLPAPPTQPHGGRP